MSNWIVHTFHNYEFFNDQSKSFLIKYHHFKTQDIKKTV